MYNFNPDPTLTKYNNAEIIIGNMKPYQFLTQTTSSNLHNFYRTITIPSGTKSILRMGLNFCLETPRPKQQILTTHKRFVNVL